MADMGLLSVWCLIMLAIFVVGGAPVEQISRGYSSSQTWFVHLLLNAVCYSGILAPLFILRYYLKRRKLLEVLKGGHYPRSSKILQLCFVADVGDLSTGDDGSTEGTAFLPLPVTSKTTPSCIVRIQRFFGLDANTIAQSPRQRYALLAVCVLGLHVSYVMWGLMQERIMTRSYDGETFGASQFLVFCNRLATLFIVLPIYCLRLGVVCNPFQSGKRAPFFEFAFASVSNIVSSWCQYEALKYVTFPTQVISKACKVIPVMVMGWFIQGRTYSLLEYITAVLISIGLSTFMLSDSTERSTTSDHPFHSQWTVFSGVALISSYMLMDSFTSNWQDRLFRKYHLSPVQVMTGVNMWSVVLTLVPLLYQGTLISSTAFGLTHPEFFLDVSTSATCSAVGQLFIFLTISYFGPATFVLIMTLRMGLSLLLSCIIFGHALSLSGIAGVCLVFGALFVRIYWRSKHKPEASSQDNNPKT